MNRKMPVRSGIITLLLLTFSCNIFKDVEPAYRQNPVSGTFRVQLNQTFEQTYLLGEMTDGPIPSSVILEEAARSGHCRLLTSRIPFCEPRCDSAFSCVEDGQCQSHPSPLTAGTVHVEGLKAKSGETAFSIVSEANNYKLPDSNYLEYPPCAEGDTVTFTFNGNSEFPPFTLSTRSIRPLEILNDTITLADGQPINLIWTPPDMADIATITVDVDISHHGGKYGNIECSNVPDNGSLEIPASLVDALKALGIAGFPKIEITRRSTSLDSTVGIGLAIESMVTLWPTIPGLISCNDISDCPEGQICQDFLCK